MMRKGLGEWNRVEEEIGWMRGCRGSGYRGSGDVREWTWYKVAGRNVGRVVEGVRGW
jgi:hypothetical protein